MKNQKRICIFYPVLDNIGGAEMVALYMAKYLDADIYTTNINLERIKEMGFLDLKIHSIGKVPITSPWRQKAIFRKFKNIKLRKNYDLFILHSEWLTPGIKNKKILLYSHTPSRDIWDLYETTKKLYPKWQRPFFGITVKYYRYLNHKCFKHIDKVICNSLNSASRFKKFLNLDVDVIYAPIDSSKYKNKKHKNYWLSVNRAYPLKRIEMQLKAFEKLPNERLIVVASYERSEYFQKYIKFLKKIKPSNVEILSFVDDWELRKLYSECKGLIATAKDEDFGLTPLEAMASGKLVIAANEGGYKETIIDGKTGFLVDDINPDKLAGKIKEIKNFEKYKKPCLEQAKKFNIETFMKKVNLEIDKLLK